MVGRDAGTFHARTDKDELMNVDITPQPHGETLPEAGTRVQTRVTSAVTRQNRHGKHSAAQVAGIPRKLYGDEKRSGKSILAGRIDRFQRAPKRRRLRGNRALSNSTVVKTAARRLSRFRARRRVGERARWCFGRASTSPCRCPSIPIPCRMDQRSSTGVRWRRTAWWVARTTGWS